MKKLVTYDSDIVGEEILSEDETLRLFSRINWYKGAFMHFPIDEKYIFQIMCEGEDIFVIEFTDTVDLLFHQKRVNHDECREAILELFEKTKVQSDMLNGFITPEKLEDPLNKLKNRLLLYGLLLFASAFVVYVVWYIVRDFFRY